AADVDALTATRRADGSPGFVVRWAGSVPDNEDHAVLAYTTPMPGAAEGVDLVGSPPRQAALDASRDSGQPVMTSPVSLLAADSLITNGQAVAFEVYAPVY